jgi:photosystem II stability/assembly factor-like uncharacterized protein
MFKRYAIITILSALIMLFPCLSFAGSWNGWIYQAPYPTGVDLGDVKFISPMKGWIVGKYGSIFYTADGGETWEAQESGTEEHLLKVFFINEKSGWVAGIQGSIIHTEDGGKTWAIQNNIKALPTKIIFVNELEGWLTCTSQAGGVVYHTRNAGRTWEKPNIGISRSVSGVFFLNPQTGWIMAGEDVYRTSDGGGKWAKGKLPVGKIRRWRPPSYPGERATNELEEGLGAEWFYGSITFANEKQGWAAVYHWIFHTEDGGQTWKLQFDTGKTDYALGPIAFRDALHGCAAGWSVICTEDGGKTWSERLGAAPNDDEGLGGVSLIGQSDGWTAGRLGRIYKTVDDGRSWKIALQSNRCGSEPFFVNKRTGWLYNWRIFNCICRTDDGGQTWVKQDPGIEVKNVFFTDDTNGWSIGIIGETKDGKQINTTSSSNDLAKAWRFIKHTTDGGKTWSTQYKEFMDSDRYSGFTGVYFTNPATGWVVAKKDTILFTKDGGNHWEHQKSGDDRNDYSRVYFINSQMGWITGFRFHEQLTGIILTTTDGGKNWKTQHTQEDVAFAEIYVTDKKEIWISGQSESGEFGMLVHTVDGGSTWSKNGFSSIDSNHMTFLNKEKGTIFSDETGFVLITTDGGKTWNRRRIPLKKIPWHCSEIFEIPVIDAK